jgi:ubiquinone/menaquinone biosynthesis C-methylase UbiE
VKPETINLLCDPLTREPLRRGTSADGRLLLESAAGGRKYFLREEIPVLLTDADSTGSNRRYRTLYDRLAPFYDLSMEAYAWVKSGGLKKRQMEYLREMDIRPGGRVLEVSIGTGVNLQYLTPDAEYYGLDLSWGMLHQCRRNLRRWNREAELFQGAAEHLPFRDGVFDSLLHMGGINFFNDIPRALREMVRVAKSGTKILIVDETEKAASRFEKAPLAGGFYARRPRTIAPPAEMLTPGMRDVRVWEIWGGELYCLTFRTP